MELDHFKCIYYCQINPSHHLSGHSPTGFALANKSITPPFFPAGLFCTTGNRHMKSTTSAKNFPEEKSAPPPPHLFFSSQQTDPFTDQYLSTVIQTGYVIYIFMYTAFSDNIITLNAVHNVSIYTTECVTSSVQHEMASMCWEKAIGAPSLSHPFKEDQVLPLSTPLLLDSSSSTCQIFWDASCLWWLLCPTVWLLGDFPSLQHVLGSTPTAVLGVYPAWVTASTSSVKTTVFMDGGRTSLDSEAPPRLFFYDWAVSVLYGLLWLCHFLDWEAWPLALFCLLFPCFLAGVSHRDARHFWIPFPVLGLLELCRLAYL